MSRWPVELDTLERREASGVQFSEPFILVWGEDGREGGDGRGEKQGEQFKNTVYSGGKGGGSE